MSAQLLYKMIKSKTEFPLHKAIKVEREDVVFLYLIEMDSQVPCGHPNLAREKLSGIDKKGLETACKKDELKREKATTVHDKTQHAIQARGSNENKTCIK